MGIFDQLQSALGGEGGNLIDQVKNMATQKGLESLLEKYPQASQYLKNVDPGKLQDIVTEITKNGIPKSLEDAQKLLAKITGPETPAKK